MIAGGRSVFCTAGSTCMRATFTVRWSGRCSAPISANRSFVASTARPTSADCTRGRPPRIHFASTAGRVVFFSRCSMSAANLALS